MGVLDGVQVAVGAGVSVEVEEGTGVEEAEAVKVGTTIMGVGAGAAGNIGAKNPGPKRANRPETTNKTKPKMPKFRPADI